MAVNPKPYNQEDRLFRTEFKGDPNIFSAQDLNRYLDAISSASNKVSSSLGAIRENWEISLTNLVATGSLAITYTFNLALTKVNPLLGTYCYYKGVRFNVPEIPASPYTYSFTVPFNPSGFRPLVAYLVLSAKKKLVQFSTPPPVMQIMDCAEFSGVEGTSSLAGSFSLPAADNYVYGEERVRVTDAPDSLTLLVDEEIIAILATIRPKTRSSNANTVDTLDINTQGNIYYNAAIPEELQNLFGHLHINNLNQIGKVTYFSGNGGIIDSLIQLADQVYQGQSLQDSEIKQNTEDIFATNQGISDAQTSYHFLLTDYFGGALIDVSGTFPSPLVAAKRWDLVTFDGRLTLPAMEPAGSKILQLPPNLTPARNIWINASLSDTSLGTYLAFPLRINVSGEVFTVIPGVVNAGTLILSGCNFFTINI